MDFIIFFFSCSNSFSVIIIFVLRLPIIIAQNRGISESELTTIRILSWVGLLFGFTWVIALILSLVWQPNNWIDKSESENKVNSNDDKSMLNFEKLEKLHSLREKKIITEKEFEQEKKKIMKPFLNLYHKIFSVIESYYTKILPI